MLYFEIDKDGKIIGRFNTRPELGKDHTIVEAEAPSETLQSPVWVLDKWVESATKSERRTYIDRLTNSEIKSWCDSNGKNEEYYLNCGIRASLLSEAQRKDSPDLRAYQSYLDKIESLIKIAKEKKEAL